MKLIFEKSVNGRRCVQPKKGLSYQFAEGFRREKELILPQVSEVEAVRHYTELSRRAFGVDNGFYPLGSCTMKYNPKINEVTASLSGFTSAHPLAPLSAVQGTLELMYDMQEALKTITGMDGITLEPAAGAHGEYTGLKLIKAYHRSRGDLARTKILVPDQAHGTNPASAVMAGFTVVNIPSSKEHGVDLQALKDAAGADTAALMLTNPSTLGLFEKNIEEVTRIVHEAGGLMYYDGANLNAVMGVVRPGDMGFDVVHLNLHKTFSAPHGGGGPGSGPVGCKQALSGFLPAPQVVKTAEGYAFAEPVDTIGKVKAFYGNLAVIIKAYTYVTVLGAEGLKEASQLAVLNANYLLAKLKAKYPYAYDGCCMHEFVLSLDELKKETGVSALDLAKCLIDKGIHPPTMYFPIIVHEALMFEPTETETKETLDEAAETLLALYDEAFSAGEAMKHSPQHGQIKRPDEVKAARTPVLIWKKR